MLGASLAHSNHLQSPTSIQDILNASCLGQARVIIQRSIFSKTNDWVSQQSPIVITTLFLFIWFLLLNLVLTNYIFLQGSILFFSHSSVLHSKYDSTFPCMTFQSLLYHVGPLANILYTPWAFIPVDSFCFFVLYKYPFLFIIPHYKLTNELKIPF